MVKYSNDCCDCATPAYPCRGIDCYLRNVPHYICDNCEKEVDEEDLRVYDDQEMCIDCIIKMLPKVGD